MESLVQEERGRGGGGRVCVGAWVEGGRGGGAAVGRGLSGGGEGGGGGYWARACVRAEDDRVSGRKRKLSTCMTTTGKFPTKHT